MQVLQFVNILLIYCNWVVATWEIHLKD